MVIVEEIGGIKIDRGNRSTRRKPAPALLCPPQKSHNTRPWFEPGPPQWEASDYPLELWRGLFMSFFFFCESIGTAATPGLLCQPQVIVKMIVDKQMECRLAGETEVLGENLPQRHFRPLQNPT
jgi:hypothetical protein